MARSYQNHAASTRRSIQIVAGIGFAAMVLRIGALGTVVGWGTGLVSPPAVAQNAPATSANPTDAPNYQVLYVDPNTGSDREGKGTQAAPLKTITQALAVAPSNTVIRLAAGTYSTASGEQFPLRLQPGVTLQGNPNRRGDNVTIEGGGRFTSDTYARQNAAIVASDWSGLTGVTVTNPNPRGYGVWVESASPVIVRNTFTGNTHDGVAVLGESDAIVQNNWFWQNGANGITVYGRATPRIQGNQIRNTGFGINIAEQAAPLVVDNVIAGNRDGVLVQGEAQPILRQNRIADNQRDGVVAINNALPDLGMQGRPGNNEIRNNGRYNIHNNATSRIIPAFGNQVSPDRLQGRVDIAGNLMPNPTASTNNRREAIAQLPPSLNPQPAGASPHRSNRQNQSERNFPAIADTTPAQTEVPTRANPIEIEVPQPASDRGQDGRRPAANRNAGNTAPQRQRRPSPLPNLDAPPNNVLPVPEANIPTSGEAPSITIDTSNRQAPGVDNNHAARLGVNYRILVDAQSERERERLRSLVPESFRVEVDERTWWQAGAFRERYRALQLLYQLRRQGLRTLMQSIESHTSN
ncbi:DUF1565 domain-containing protein [Geitlerinema sp. PCC 9228]|uniref:DUF1565 domain-containing protein n=1 Tax=Geitlerinema sp. PCC 9228 TaxID=111611 RepID=UPI0008F9C518|nr:DUF1565 domain-containing protein [Geitlerinema sp. PCC 9228]